jgi:opacity protein-like surface antigen
MSRKVLVALLFTSLTVSTQSARTQDRSLSVSFRANVTTSSRLFTDPKSSSAFQRSQYFSLDDFFGYGVELRYQFPESNIAIGLSSDYVKTTTQRALPRLSTNSPTVPIEDGYSVVPVELTGYFLIPVSGQTFGVYMGGGVGGYFGKRLYTLGDTEAPSTESGHGFGIHVLGGVSYRFTEWFSLNAEMKFRDLQFETTNEFPSQTITYRGTVIPVQRLDSSVHTDGVIFQLGTVFHI